MSSFISPTNTNVTNNKYHLINSVALNSTRLHTKLRVTTQMTYTKSQIKLTLAASESQLSGGVCDKTGLDADWTIDHSLEGASRTCKALRNPAAQTTRTVSRSTRLLSTVILYVFSSDLLIYPCEQIVSIRRTLKNYDNSNKKVEIWTQDVKAK